MTQVNRPKEWWMAMADRESGHPIGAGAMSERMPERVWCFRMVTEDAYRRLWSDTDPAECHLPIDYGQAHEYVIASTHAAVIAERDALRAEVLALRADVARLEEYGCCSDCGATENEEHLDGCQALAALAEGST